jgi:phospholipid/cholesterol/gamma-HCH transport system permease protein
VTRLRRSIERALHATGGALFLLAAAAWECRLAPLHLTKILAQMAEIGAATLPITAMMSLFIGGVLSLQTGSALANYGIEGTLGGIVGVSMVKELGPVMTAILLTGRVGSAMAAEIGAMSVYQEIDALLTMNISPVRFLVMPRLLSTVVVLPVLVIYSDAIGWIGGGIVSAVNHRIDIPFRLFMRNLTETVEFNDVTNGLIKSIVFGVIIATTCCYVGLHTAGGPREVGQSVTKAVVFSFILILIFDYVVTRILFL